jgi:hypothetical protein
MTRSEAVPRIFGTINRPALNLMATEKVAQVFIYLASSPEVEGVIGEYFDHSNKRVKSSKASYEEAAQKRVWEVSAEFTKLDQGLSVQETDRTQ